MMFQLEYLAEFPVALMNLIFKHFRYRPILVLGDEIAPSCMQGSFDFLQ